VKVWRPNAIRNSKFPVAPANYFDWRKQTRSLRNGAFSGQRLQLASSESEPERYLGAVCDHGFFETLGVTPALDDSSMKMRSDRAATAFVVLVTRSGGSGSAAIRKPSVRTWSWMASRERLLGHADGFQYPATAVMWAPLDTTMPCGSGATSIACK